MMKTEKIMPTIKQAESALFDTVEIFKKLNFRFIIDGGTLLGFYRDGTFAEDDQDDVDLSVPSIYLNNLQGLIIEMTGKGFDIYHEWAKNESRRWSHQISFKRDNVKIDIMFKEEEKEKKVFWWTVYGGKKGVTYKSVPAVAMNVTKPFKINLKEIAEEIIVFIPDETPDYLNYRYGNWEKKVNRKDYSCYKTDLSIKESYEKI